MRPNSPRTRSRCPFCRLDVIVTLPVPLTGDRGDGIGGSSMGWSHGKKVEEERKHWRKQGVTSCNSLSGRLEFPRFTASAAALAEQNCQQAPHYISPQCCLMVKETHELLGSHCLHNSFRTPQKAQSPGKNVALDGCICICPLFLSEPFPTVCLLLITDWEFSKADQQWSSLSGRSSPIIFPLWTVHLLFLLFSSIIQKNLLHKYLSQFLEFSYPAQLWENCTSEII